VRFYLLFSYIGERITLKDNNPMYSSGNSQKSLLTSLTENLEKVIIVIIKFIIDYCYKTVIKIQSFALNIFFIKNIFFV